MERNFVCTKDYPIADTVHGKIRGFELDGILTFHGIKYADAQRFQKPRTSPKLGGCKNCMELWIHCPHLWQSHPQRGAFHSSPFLARQRALPVFEHLDQVLK